MNLNNNETEIPEDQLEEYALKLYAKYFPCRSKAKTKPQRREIAGSSPRIILIGRRNWIDIETGKFSFSECEVSKKVASLLRHSQQMHREEDGAIHFWRKKKIFRANFHNLFLGLTIDGKHAWWSERKISVLYWWFRNNSLFPSSSRTFRNQSYWSFTTEQCCYSEQLFQHIYHNGCAFNLQSIINSGIIPGGQSSSKRQTVFFLLIDLMDKSHKDQSCIW